MSTLPRELFIFTDGGSRGNPGPAAIGVAVVSAEGETIYELSHYIGEGTNNEAEYQAVLKSLEWLTTQSVTADQIITWKLDSKLVVEQLKKNWKIKEPRMAVYANQAWIMLEKLACKWQFVHVPREENKRADWLVNEALDAQAA